MSPHLSAASDIQRVIELLVHLGGGGRGSIREMPVHSPGHNCLRSLARHGPRRPALVNYNSHSSKVLTSRMAEQKRLCRTRCRACSFCGGSSPLRCSRSSSSTARDTSAKRSKNSEVSRKDDRGQAGSDRRALPVPRTPTPGGVLLVRSAPDPPTPVGRAPPTLTTPVPRHLTGAAH